MIYLISPYIRLLFITLKIYFNIPFFVIFPLFIEFEKKTKFKREFDRIYTDNGHQHVPIKSSNSVDNKRKWKWKWKWEWEWEWKWKWTSRYSIQPEVEYIPMF